MKSVFRYVFAAGAMIAFSAIAAPAVKAADLDPAPQGCYYYQGTLVRWADECRASAFGQQSDRSVTQPTPVAISQPDPTPPDDGCGGDDGEGDGDTPKVNARSASVNVSKPDRGFGFGNSKGGQSNGNSDNGWKH